MARHQTVTGAATGRRGASFLAPWRPTLRAVDTDAEMVARLRNGDEEAFVALVGRYQQPMLRLARSFVPSQAVAEEAVQDTWLGLVRGIENFEGRSSFKTWLFRILVNRARSAGTKEHPGAPTEALHAVDPIGGEEVDSLAALPLKEGAQRGGEGAFAQASREALLEDAELRVEPRRQRVRAQQARA